MSDIPSFPYRILWEERQVISVANLTRQDAIDFLAMAPKAGVATTTVSYPLEAANEALADLREGRLQGAAVLVPSFVEDQSVVIKRPTREADPTSRRDSDPIAHEKS
jgi:D-arabinose 1-dehydrogenase-like Zn-dependent alcohol dehydrogenase